jgi:hypothetical protein
MVTANLFLKGLFIFLMAASFGMAEEKLIPSSPEQVAAISSE